MRANEIMMELTLVLINQDNIVLNPYFIYFYKINLLFNF